MAEPAPEWTSEETKILIDQWLDGTPASQIGIMLGKTKSAITGKAHRLMLPARQNPISATGREAKPKNPKPKPHTHRLPQIHEVKRKPLPRANHPLGKGACQWPMWGDEAPTHEFCGETIQLGSSYCPAHRARAIKGVWQVA